MVEKPTCYDTNFAKTASVGEVPEWLPIMKSLCDAYEAVCAQSGLTCSQARPSWYAKARAYIAAHEPEPVDPLREALEELRLAEQCIGAVDWVERATDFLRQRGVTAGERGR